MSVKTTAVTVSVSQMHDSSPSAVQPFWHVDCSALGYAPPSQRTRKTLSESCVSDWSVLESWMSVTLRHAGHSRVRLITACQPMARLTSSQPVQPMASPTSSSRGDSFASHESRQMLSQIPSATGLCMRNVVRLAHTPHRPLLITWALILHDVPLTGLSHDRSSSA
eukprot:4583336-Prymnesium_polylepis.1